MRAGRARESDSPADERLQELVINIRRHRGFDPRDRRVLGLAPQHQHDAAHAARVVLDA